MKKKTKSGRAQSLAEAAVLLGKASVSDALSACSQPSLRTLREWAIQQWEAGLQDNLSDYVTMADDESADDVEDVFLEAFTAEAKKHLSAG
jgi:hypothetical protein